MLIADAFWRVYACETERPRSLSGGSTPAGLNARGANISLTTKPNITDEVAVNHNRILGIHFAHTICPSLRQYLWDDTSPVQTFANIAHWIPSADAIINQLADEADAITFAKATSTVEAHQDIQPNLMAIDPLKTARAFQPPTYMGCLLKGVRHIPRSRRTTDN